METDYKKKALHMPLTHSTTRYTNRWRGGRFETSSRRRVRELVPEHGDAFHLQVFMCECGRLVHINVGALLVRFIAVNNPASDHNQLD